MAYRKYSRRRVSEPLNLSHSHGAGDPLCNDDDPLSDGLHAAAPSGSPERRRAATVDEACPLRPFRASAASPSYASCRSCFRSAAAADGSPEPSSLLPWKLQWLLSPWIDLPLTTAQARVKEAVAAVLAQEEAAAREQDEFLLACYEAQLGEEKAWKSFDSSRSTMYMDGRTIKSSLEEADHQRAAARVATWELQQRAAVAKWATVMRTLSAEWSPWAVEVSEASHPSAPDGVTGK